MRTSSRRPATRPKLQTGSPGSLNTRISLGKRILSQEWHMIQSTFLTAMFRLLSDCTSFFTSRFQKLQMGVGTSKLPQSHCFQHEHFPKVWTSEGLTTCFENGYQWNINSTTWTQVPRSMGNPATERRMFCVYG